MKLTNYMRNVFIRSVMQDVPHPDYSKLHDEAQEALVKAMSPKVRAVYIEYPDALKTTYTNFGRECRTLYHGGLITPKCWPRSTRRRLLATKPRRS